MKGKEKCKALKEIRRQVAEANDIPYVVSQCTHKGDCKGTCPKCEAELQYLERELAFRKNLGKAVAITGISMGVCASLTGCGTSSDPITSPPAAGSQALSGAIPLETFTIPEQPDVPDSEETPSAPEDPDVAGYLMPTETPGSPETEEIMELEGDIALPEDPITP